MLQVIDRYLLNSSPSFLHLVAATTLFYSSGDLHISSFLDTLLAAPF